MTDKKQTKATLRIDAEVTAKPWWNQPFVQTFLVGFLGLIGIIITWQLNKPKPAFDQSVIENSNLTYIDFNQAKMTFTSSNNPKNKYLVDILIPVHVNGNASTNIYFNRGNGYELVGTSKEQMDFPVIFSYLRCDTEYFFRIDPNLNDKRLRGATSRFKIPPCIKSTDRDKFIADPHFVSSFYSLNAGAAK